jgi:hypothetical protein
MSVGHAGILYSGSGFRRALFGSSRAILDGFHDRRKPCRPGRQPAEASQPVEDVLGIGFNVLVRGAHELLGGQELTHLRERIISGQLRRVRLDADPLSPRDGVRQHLGDVALRDAADDFLGAALKRPGAREQVVEHGTQAEEVRPALPDYPQADFEKNLPGWRNVVESGRKTASDLLAMLQTKATFSASQQAEILKLGQDEEAPDAGTADDGFVKDMEAAEAQQ